MKKNWLQYFYKAAKISVSLPAFCLRYAASDVWSGSDLKRGRLCTSKILSFTHTSSPAEIQWEGQKQRLCLPIREDLGS